MVLWQHTSFQCIRIYPGLLDWLHHLQKGPIAIVKGICQRSTLPIWIVCHCSRIHQFCRDPSGSYETSLIDGAHTVTSIFQFFSRTPYTTTVLLKTRLLKRASELARDKFCIQKKKKTVFAIMRILSLCNGPYSTPHALGLSN